MYFLTFFTFHWFLQKRSIFEKTSKIKNIIFLKKEGLSNLPKELSVIIEYCFSYSWVHRLACGIVICALSTWLLLCPCVRFWECGLHITTGTRRTLEQTQVLFCETSPVSALCAVNTTTYKDLLWTLTLNARLTCVFPTDYCSIAVIMWCVWWNEVCFLKHVAVCDSKSVWNLT